MLYFSIFFKGKGGRRLSVFMIVLYCMALVFAAGAVYYLKLLGQAASYPPKRVVRQKAIVCSAGTALALFLIFFTKLLV